MENRRIPATLEEFNTHLLNVNTYLHKTETGTSQMRGEILGMTITELNTLHNIKMTWSSGDPLHPGIWDLHRQKNKKTVVTRLNVLHIIKEFSEFFRPILIRISSSPNITVDDRIVLRIAPPVTKRSIPKLRIGEQCVTKYIVQGGARIKFKCHTSHESGRSAKPPRADAVELSYLLVLPHLTSPDGEIVAVDHSFDPQKNPTKHISTKASFLMEFDLTYRGYQMHFWARWINTRHPDLNGVWTGPYMCFIG
jgi:hypothetical protein